MSVVGVLNERKNFRREFSDYINILRERSDKDKIKEFSELRNINIKAIEDAEIFYIDNMAEMLVPSYLDRLQEFGIISPNNNKPIYHERWIIPIKDSDGLVQALVGYSPYADERYVYSTTNYYMRGDTLWGLEKLNRAYELGYAILVEGITDAIHIRSIGYEPVFASCGTRPSDLNMMELNRCRYGLIRIPDRDSAGNKTKRHWKTNRYLTLITPILYKDSDETLRESEENVAWFKEYLNASIEWIQEIEHKGLKCENITLCMM